MDDPDQWWWWCIGAIGVLLAASLAAGVAAIVEPEFGVGAVLPGDVLGAAAVTSGALTAPFGAGDAAPLLLDAAALDMLMVPALELVGAMFPGEAWEGATCGEAMEPVGAGAVVEAVVGGVALWAQAMLVVISNAVEASQIVRMIVS